MTNPAPEWITTLSDDTTMLEVKLVNHHHQYVIDVHICGQLVATHTEKDEAAARQTLRACHTAWYSRLNAIATNSYLRGHGEGYKSCLRNIKEREKDNA